MSYKKIQVLMLEPGKYPAPTTLSTSANALKKAVNKGIENNYKVQCKRISGELCVLYNNNQIQSPLAPNRKIYGEILCGVIYIVAVTPDNKLRSLTFKEFQKCIRRFWFPEEYTAEEATVNNLTYLYQRQCKGVTSRAVKVDFHN